MSRAAASTHLFRRVASIVARERKIPMARIQAPYQRKTHVARARREAVYLTHVACGMSLAQVGEAAGVSRWAILKSVRQVEDHRDDPVYDRFLDLLTTEIAR